MLFDCRLNCDAARLGFVVDPVRNISNRSVVNERNWTPRIRWTGLSSIVPTCDTSVISPA